LGAGKILFRLEVLQLVLDPFAPRRVDREVIFNRLVEGFLFALGDEDVAIRTIPGRDLVAPPQLARDAPRLDVLHPLEISLFPVLRNELGAARTNGLDR